MSDGVTPEKKRWTTLVRYKRLLSGGHSNELDVTIGGRGNATLGIVAALG